MMSSCCTLRLKRRRAFSRDSLSWMMTSATLLIHPQSGSDWHLAEPLAGQTAAGCVFVRAPPLGADYLMYCPLRRCTLKGSWPLLINSRPASQGIFAFLAVRGLLNDPQNILNKQLAQLESGTVLNERAWLKPVVAPVVAAAG